eukprot:g3226.t1
MMQELSAKWRSLSKKDREKYEKLAAADAERFEQEHAAADAAKLKDLEKRHAERDQPTSSYMRERKVVEVKKKKKVDPVRQKLKELAKKSVDIEEKDRKKKSSSSSSISSSCSLKDEKSEYGVDLSKLSEKEFKLFKVLHEAEVQRRIRNAERQVLRKARDEKLMIQKRLHDKLSQDREKASAKRLKFLMGQSSLFAHFMNAAAAEPGTPGEQVGSLTLSPPSHKSPRKSRNPLSPRNSPRGTPSRRERMQEEDEDQQLLAESLSDRTTTRLQVQPALVVGGKMRGYQLEGLNWLIQLHESGMNGILADEMGLGKTLQTISLFAFLSQFKQIQGPHLVIAPKSTLGNWKLEMQRWCPSLRAFVFLGNRAEREKMIAHELEPGLVEADRRFDVCITSYEIAIIEKGALTKHAWQYLAVDEAHRLKNENSKLAKTLRMYHVAQRLLITGTPLQNNLHELWALLNFLLPEVFKSSEAFDSWFDLATSDDKAKEKMIHQLHKILRPFMLRRLKSDVAQDLKPKINTHLYVGMTDMQRDLYKKILLREMETFSAAATGGSSRVKLSNILMQLRKVCNHPYLFDGVEDRTLDPNGEHLVENCGKMVLLDKLLRKLKAQKRRVLIFSQMTRLLDILEDFCGIRDYSYCRIDGSTDGDDRQEQIEEYNKEGSDIFLFLLSTRAGGLGINLQSADTVVLFDSDWNPQVDLQAQDRAHRIGQKKQVHVYRILTENSVEEKIIERAEMKLRLDAVVVQNGRLPESSKQLTKAEMQAMVKYGANEVFRAKGSMVTDEDIEAILSRGKERTKALQDKMDEQCGKQGIDLLNFSVTGTNMQEFDGEDYSAEGRKRKKEQEELERMMAAEFVNELHDAMGKRSRKKVAYDTNAQFRELLQTDSGPKMRKLKLPKRMRLPRMQDWHLFDKNRLLEIQAIEEKRYEDWKANPPMITVKKKKKGKENSDKEEEEEQALPQLLTPELEEEKEKLLSAGFPSWKRRDLQVYIGALELHGRDESSKTQVYEEMLRRGVDKKPSEIDSYGKRFWEFGSQCLADFPKFEARVKRGEEKKRAHEKLVEIARKVVSWYPIPWEQLEFKYVGAQKKDWKEEEDRFLVCWVVQHGTNRWEELQRSIRSAESFSWNYLFRTRTPEQLEQRCTMLLKICKKTYDGFIRKNEERLAKEAARKKALVERGGDVLQEVQNGTESVSSEIGNKRMGKGPLTKSVPESSLPLLAQMLIDGETIGVNACAKEFLSEVPGVSKRQIKLTIEEIAEKRRRKSDGKLVWFIRDKFERLLKKSEKRDISDVNDNGEVSGCEKGHKTKKRRLEL